MPPWPLALASSLIGSFFKAWYTGWRINQVDRRYKQCLRQAKEMYHMEAVQEYELAAQEANLAWQKFTGRPPAITDAFRVLIVGLLSRGSRTRGTRFAAGVGPGRPSNCDSGGNSAPEILEDGPGRRRLPADITSVAGGSAW